MNRKTRVTVLVAALVAVGLMIVITKRMRQTAEQEQPAPAEAQTIEALFKKARETMQAGDTNAVLELFSTAYKDPRYSEDRPRLLNGILHVLLMGKRVAEAEARFLEAAQTDMSLVVPNLGMIYGYKYRADDSAAIFAWTQQLMELKWPEGAADRVYVWHLDACYRLDRRNDIKTLVPACFEKFPPTTAVAIMSHVVNGLIARKDYGQARGLLTLLEPQRENVPELSPMIRKSEMDLAMEQGVWEEVFDKFMNAAAGANDEELRSLLARVSQKATSAGRTDIVDQVCDFVMSRHKDKPRTLAEAARQWVAILRKDNLPDAFPDRFDMLERLGVPADVRAGLFRDQFYFAVGSGKPETVARMVTIGKALEEALPAGDDKERMKVMLVDGCFVTEDYEGALKLLDAGIQGRDETWTSMAKDKVRAHLALKRGDAAEAVRNFRKFMDYVATWKDAETDPSTGIRYSKEMTLGQNAKRIGDIWKNAGNTEKAAAAYAESRDYYLKSLADPKITDKSRELVRKEMGALPAAPARTQETVAVTNAAERAGSPSTVTNAAAGATNAPAVTNLTRVVTNVATVVTEVIGTVTNKPAVTNAMEGAPHAAATNAVAQVVNAVIAAQPITGASTNAAAVTTNETESATNRTDTAAPAVE